MAVTVGQLKKIIEKTPDDTIVQVVKGVDRIDTTAIFHFEIGRKKFLLVDPVDSTEKK